MAANGTVSIWVKHVGNASSNSLMNFDPIFIGYVQFLMDRDLITQSKSHLVLTKKGKLVADKIASDFFVED